MQPLPYPIHLYLFDGSATSSGIITHSFTTEVIFPPTDEVQTIEFLITKLHPSARIVLGFPWLRTNNPHIDWANLTLRLPAGDPSKSVPNPSSTGAPTLAALKSVPNLSRARAQTLAANQSVPKTEEPSKKVTPDVLPPSRIALDGPELLDDEFKSQKLDIQIIGAAPFDLLRRQGAECFMLNSRTLFTDPPGTDPPDGDLPDDSTDFESDPKEHKTFRDTVPEEYHDFEDVFAKKPADSLPPHRPYDHTIELEDGQTPPHGPIYSLSQKELEELREYLEDNLRKGFVRPSSSPAGAPILFAKKKDGSLRLCVDYRGLNKITRKNRYPLPLIGELLDQLRDARVFTKLDLRVGYNNVRIAAGHEWKTAFRTRYGSFEYLVMPFGMTNSPATFQHFMNDIFRDMADKFVVVYLDDILIFSKDPREHSKHVRLVLQRLRDHNLHIKLEKCTFHTDTIEYLGFVVSPQGISMDSEKTKAIRDWPVPRNVRDIQSFLGFANFYRRFIDNYSKITVPLTRLTRKDIPFKWGPPAQEAFEQLKRAFEHTPILAHFDPTAHIVVETDASDYAIGCILSQILPGDNDLHPIAFHSRTMSQAEVNYDIYDKELLAIFAAFEHWRN